MAQNFDAIIIGSGQAGPALAARLTAAGMSVAFIEREHLGGTCVNDGCTPTKTLVASAQAAFVARRHGDFGVTIGGPVGVREEGAIRGSRPLETLHDVPFARAGIKELARTVSRDLVACLLPGISVVELGHGKMAGGCFE